MKTRPLSKALVTVLKLIGKVVAKICPSAMALPPCDLDNDEANDLVRGWLEHPDGQGHMATKLGTYELKAFLCFTAMPMAFAEPTWQICCATATRFSAPCVIRFGG